MSSNSSSSQKSVVLIILIIEVVGFMVVELCQDPDARPFIEHMNAVVFGPGFLGALFCWLSQDSPSKAPKVLSILCISLSCCIYVSLLVPLLVYFDQIRGQLEIPFIVVTIVNLLCNVVVLLQYGGTTREG